MPTNHNQVCLEVTTRLHHSVSSAIILQIKPNLNPKTTIQVLNRRVCLGPVETLHQDYLVVLEIPSKTSRSRFLETRKTQALSVKILRRTQAAAFSVKNLPPRLLASSAILAHPTTILALVPKTQAEEASSAVKPISRRQASSASRHPLGKQAASSEAGSSKALGNLILILVAYLVRPTHRAR